MCAVHGPIPVPTARRGCRLGTKRPVPGLVKNPCLWTLGLFPSDSSHSSVVRSGTRTRRGIRPDKPSREPITPPTFFKRAGPTVGAEGRGTQETPASCWLMSVLASWRMLLHGVEQSWVHARAAEMIERSAHVTTSGHSRPRSFSLNRQDNPVHPCAQLRRALQRNPA
jgi:hypothetical protein